MKITYIDIYGFGKWEDQQFDFSKAPFIILQGENEAGKSTLHQFMLFMLFGLPPKERSKFLPKKGGKLGGKMTLITTDQTEFTIERLHDRYKGAARCFTKQGEIKDEVWLNEQLTGMNKDTFMAIFSFNAVMLQRLQQMKQQDIGEVLLGVGMTGTDQIYWTEKWINQQADELFKPQGKKPKINQLLESISKQAQVVTEMTEEANQYQQKQHEKRHLEKELEAWQEQQRSLQQQLQFTKQQIHQYDTIQAFQSVQEEINAYPISMIFPTNGLARYDNLKNAMYPIKSEWRLVKQRLQKENNRLDQLQHQLLDEKDLKALTSALENAAALEKRNQSLQEKQLAKEKLHNQLTFELNELQIDVTIEDLQLLSFPFATEDMWLQLKNEKSDVQRLLTTIEAEQQSLEEQHTYLQAEKEAINHRQIDHNELHELYQAVAKEEQIIENQEKEALQQKQQKKWYQLKRKKQRQANWIVMIGFCVALLIATIAFVWKQSVGYLVAGILFVISLIIQWLLYQSIKSMEMLFQSTKQDRSDRVLSDQALLEWKQDIAFQEELKNDKEKIDSQLRELDLMMLKLEEKRQFQFQRQQLIKQKINDQVVQFPFLKDINIEHWGRLYHRLIALGNQATQYQRLAMDLEQYKQQTKRLDTELRQAYRALFNEEESTGSSIEILYQALRQLHDQHQLAVQQKSQILQNKKQFKETLDDLHAQLEPYQQEINQLFEMAQVESEEAYILKGKQKQRHEQLQSMRKTYREQVYFLFTETEWKKIEKGEKINKVELETKHQQLVEKLNEITKKIQTQQQYIADINAMIIDLETSQALVDHKHYYYQLKNQLNQYAKQWAIYQLAKTKMEATKHVYFQSYLPAVLAETSILFQSLTTERYQSVYLREESGELLVEDKQGIQYHVQELSQGTKDQLYVSLRIAMASIIGQKHTMPFFVDDAFVHFDSIRLQKMLALFANLTERYQIIWFTKEDVSSSLFSDKENVMIQKI